MPECCENKHLKSRRRFSGYLSPAAVSSCRCFALQATTDLYGKCTTRHSGTSAAAPEAAGVFALALEAKSVSLYDQFYPFTIR